MNVLVTGADGLLGSNIVRELLMQGHDVRVILQPGKSSVTLDGLNIQRFTADILQPESLKIPLAGVDGVIHVAANTSIWPPRSVIVRNVNIEGTINVAQAALRAQVKRFVHIGTANSFTPGTKEQPGDESTGYTCARFGLDYMDSKNEAQNRVLALVQSHGLPALTVNPTFMIGPFDSTPSSGAMIVNLYRGKIPGYTPGGKCFVHVRDVAQAAVNGLSMGTIGQSYICGNQNLSYREFFALAAKVMEVEPPRFQLPKALAMTAGMAGSLWGRISGRTPTISRAIAQIGWEGHYYDSTKARKELLLPATPLETAVQECFAWLKDNGYL